MKLSKYNQQTVDNIKWKHPQEPVLKAWTTRGLPHDKPTIYKSFYTTLGVITIFSLIVLSLLLIAAMQNGMFIGSIVIFLFFYVPIIALVYFSMLGGRLYSFRLTERYIEVVTWKDYYHRVKLGISIFLIIIGIFLFVAFLIKPETILVSLGGAIGVAILAGGNFYSDSFAQREVDYKHHSWQWKKNFDPKRIIIDRDRSIVCIDGEPTDDLTAKRKKWALFIFCEASELDEVATIISGRFPDIKVLEGASRIDNSFAL